MADHRMFVEVDNGVALIWIREDATLPEGAKRTSKQPAKQPSPPKFHVHKDGTPKKPTDTNGDI